ncbi:MAG: endonuclease I family protein, partial [Pseudomonadota bacterium]
MRPLALATLALVLLLAPQTVSPAAADLDGLAGDPLVRAVERLAETGQAPLSYAELWSALEETDEDPANPDHVLLFYSGRSHPKADKLSDALNRGNWTANSWNREHVWPRSKGFRNARDLAHNDLHHVRATDAACNERRGSLDFDEGGARLRGCAARIRDGRSFEPRDAVKGDVARMLFYMDVRYNGQGRLVDLRLVERTGTRGTELGRLCTLLRWHETDPVDDLERRRHDRIVAIQGNRNPFVDQPELAERIYG